MSDKELIKQEIERRYNCEKCYPLDIEANVAAAVLQELLLFIDSLPKESGCEVNFTTKNENLVEEVDNFLKDQVFGKLINRYAGIALARHFAEWQKQKMKDALQTEYEKGRFDMREEMMKMAEDTAGLSLSWGKDSKTKIIIIEEEQQ